MPSLSAQPHSLKARAAVAVVAVALLVGGIFAVHAEPGAAENFQAETGADTPILVLPETSAGAKAADPKMDAVLTHLPDPDSLPVGAAAKDDVPEPGTLVFGLAVLAIGLGKLVQSFARCWRTINAPPR